MLPVQAGVGGESEVCYRFRPELVANPGVCYWFRPELVANLGFVTGLGRSWWRIRGFRVFRGFRVGVGGDFRIFRDRVADLATGAAIIS